LKKHFSFLAYELKEIPALETFDESGRRKLRQLGQLIILKSCENFDKI